MFQIIWQHFSAILRCYEANHGHFTSCGSLIWMGMLALADFWFDNGHGLGKYGTVLNSNRWLL